MRQIVVGYVDADTARQALNEAAKLAVDLGANLHVVTALEDPQVDVIDAGGEQFTINDFESAEQAIRNLVEVMDPRPSYTSAVLSGKAADVLISEAERLEADMIVVGNVRMQGPGRILGSVGSKVTHHAPCNVLIIKTV